MMETKELVKLLLSSCNNLPNLGKLSHTENIIASIYLAKLFLDFANKGYEDEAMYVSSLQWTEVINKLEVML